MSSPEWIDGRGREVVIAWPFGGQLFAAFFRVDEIRVRRCWWCKDYTDYDDLVAELDRRYKRKE